MSDSVRPHRRQPTRLPRPWDSPGKNTGVGCHVLLQGMKMKSESESEVVSNSWRPHGLQPTRLLRPWDFPGKSTGVGCHCLLCFPLKMPTSDHCQLDSVAIYQENFWVFNSKGLTPPKKLSSWIQCTIPILCKNYKGPNRMLQNFLYISQYMLFFF